MRLIAMLAAVALCACASGPDSYSLPPDHPALAESAPAAPVDPVSAAPVEPVSAAPVEPAAAPAQPPGEKSAATPAAPPPDALEAFRRLMGEGGSAFRREQGRGAREAPPEQDAQGSGGGHEQHR